MCSLAQHFALDWFKARIDDLYEYVDGMQKSHRWIEKMASVLYVRINIQNAINLEPMKRKIDSSACGVKYQLKERKKQTLQII